MAMLDPAVTMVTVHSYEIELAKVSVQDVIPDRIKHELYILSVCGAREVRVDGFGLLLLLLVVRDSSVRSVSEHLVGHTNYYSENKNYMDIYTE